MALFVFGGFREVMLRIVFWGVSSSVLGRSKGMGAGPLQAHMQCPLASDSGTTPCIARLTAALERCEADRLVNRFLHNHPVFLNSITCRDVFFLGINVTVAERSWG